jgi:hypothetical protein
MEQTIVEKKLPGEHETPVQKACYTQQKNNWKKCEPNGVSRTNIQIAENSIF